MNNGIFYKEYIAVLNGILKNKSGIINASISRKEKSIIERKVSPHGETAVTEYEVLKTFNELSLVKFVLKTGRTHQIRVHSSYIGHPILGDTLYGLPSTLISRQALHAYKVKIIHPILKKTMEFVAPIPEDIENVVTNVANSIP